MRAARVFARNNVDAGGPTALTGRSGHPCWSSSFSLRRLTLTVHQAKLPRLKPELQRRGLSLFEVVIALAVFACSMVAIGHLISAGVRSALRSRLEAQAILRCESKLGELAAGIIPLQNASGVAFPDDQSWNWSMTIATGQYPNLYTVEVTATHPATTMAGKISYSIRRLMRDPQLEMLAYQKLIDNPPISQSSTSSSTSGSSSTGAGQ